MYFSVEKYWKGMQKQPYNSLKNSFSLNFLNSWSLILEELGKWSGKIIKLRIIKHQ